MNNIDLLEQIKLEFTKLSNAQKNRLPSYLQLESLEDILDYFKTMNKEK